MAEQNAETAEAVKENSNVESNEVDEATENDNVEESKLADDTESSNESENPDEGNDTLPDEIRESTAFKEAVAEEVEKTIQQRIERSNKKQNSLESEITTLKTEHEKELEKITRDKIKLELALENGIQLSDFKFINGSSKEELQQSISEFLDRVSIPEKKNSSISEVFKSKDISTKPVDPTSAALMNKYFSK